jgi:hypothetical protein
MRGAASLLVAAALVAAACGGHGPTYAWEDGRVVRMSVTLHEALMPGSAGREVRISGEGRVAGGNAFEMDVLSVRHKRQLGGRAVSVVDTETSGVAPADRSAEDVALARIAEGMRGRRVRLVFDAADGLTGVEGLADALRLAGGEADAEAPAGLRLLLADDAVLRGLRAAGLAGIPHAVREARGEAQRSVDLFVPGRGLVACRLLGVVGPGPDGSPIVKASGQVRDDAPARGDPGPTPPDEVGPVRLGRVEVEAETLHDRATSLPLRGRATVRMPYASGATVVTTTSFLLAVPE